MDFDQPNPEIIERCRELRHNPTQAEIVLWDLLRNRRLEGYKFRRQHPVSRLILDFYCEDLHLAIEVDGGVHLEPDQEEYDLFRTQMLNQLGIRVLQFWNNDVIRNPEKVLEVIREALLSRDSFRTP